MSWQLHQPVRGELEIGRGVRAGQSPVSATLIQTTFCIVSATHARSWQVKLA